MKFLTWGFYCDRADCKLPHVTNIDSLTAAEKTILTEFVKKQPGLSWPTAKLQRVRADQDPFSFLSKVLLLRFPFSHLLLVGFA
jgi:hypothetical protein